MLHAVGISGASLLFLFALFHIYWAFGGRWGYRVAFPRVKSKTVFKIGHIEMFLLGVGLAAAGFLILGRMKIWTIWAIWRYYRSGVLLLSAFALIRAVGDFRYLGFFKDRRFDFSSKIDTWVISPLCLYIAWVCIYVSLFN